MEQHARFRTGSHQLAAHRESDAINPLSILAVIYKE